jgi:L-lactate dehydrogenase complex protein LldF
VYAGPIGAVLTPALLGIGASQDLPSASSFCGRCEEVCPVRIPLPKLLRQWREAAHASGVSGWGSRQLLKLWAATAKRPALYHVLARAGVALLRMSGGARGSFRSLPLGRGWTRFRDFPVPQGKTFQQRWAKRGKSETP